MGPCWEGPIPLDDWTPENGKEQLRRMRACYDKQWRFRTTFLLVNLVAFLIVLGIILVSAALQSGLGG